HDGRLYLPDSTQPQPITVLDFAGKQVDAWGTSEDFGSAKENRARNLRHLSFVTIAGENLLVSVGLSEPRVELFTLAGRRTAELSLAHHPSLRESLAATAADFKRDPEQRHNPHALFMDMYVEGRDLYLLFFNGDQSIDRTLVLRLERDR